MKKKIPFMLLISILLISCQNKIDTSSFESMQSSIQKINESLNDKEEKEFQDALGLIMLNGFNFQDIMKEGNVDNSENDYKSKIDGKTAKEIIAIGNKIKAENERKKREQAKIEIDELYLAKEQAAKDKQELAKFKVIKSRFYIRQSGSFYITKEPIIELTVMNGTNTAISRAYFTGTLASPERTVPWVKDDFNYEISGGLEPNEEVTWRLAPNMFSDWGEVKAPKNAILTVEVNKLDGPDGETIYSIDKFGKAEQERLKELLSSYPEFIK